MQGSKMLSKTVKIIGLLVIIEISKFNSYGNQIDVFFENSPTLVAEGLGGIFLPKELTDPKSELWHCNKYGSRFQFIGLRLNFPKAIIQACKDMHWEIKDKTLISKLESVVSSQENFTIWCRKQKNFTEIQGLIHIYAYILEKINQKNYLIPKDFCRRIDLSAKIRYIYLKEATSNTSKIEIKTSTEALYLKNFEELMKCMCRQTEEM